MKKFLLTSILSVVMCISLIAGATFALFTSESKVNIAVTSGTVNVTATIDQSSVYTKKLGVDYTQGANNMFEGVANFDQDGLALSKFMPGDGIKFNIVVENNSDVTIKYRTIINCENDNGLFAGLSVNIADRQNYNGNEYITNWATLDVGSADAIIPVVIELPESAGNVYQGKTCTVSYMVEAIQGNAKTENVSSSVEINGSVAGDVELKTNGDDSPIVTVPVDVLNDISKTGADSVALKHSEPKYDETTNSINFETMEIVDEQGKEIDLEALENNEEITVKLPVQTKFAKGTLVYIYHDGEYIDTVTVNDDGSITYMATHFCKVAVSTDILSDSIRVANYNELKTALSKAKKDITIIFDADIKVTQQLLLNKGIKVTLDLNGYDIDADYTPTHSDTAVFKVYDDKELVLTSSRTGAEINVGKKSLVFAQKGSNVEVFNIKVAQSHMNKLDSLNKSLFDVKGSLTIGTGTVVEVTGVANETPAQSSGMFASLINCSNVTIDGATISIQNFNTNAGTIISNGKSGAISIKNTIIDLELNSAYTQYFVAWTVNVDVSFDNNTYIVKDDKDNCYEVVSISYIDTDDRIGFKKIDIDDVKNKLKSKGEVVLNGSLVVDATESNAYGATALNIFGGTLDMNGGNILKATGATGTWDSTISITAGTIKNVKISQGFRGIFINHNGEGGKVYLENVIIDGTTYTISCDQGTKNGLEATNCTFKGWTSYAATIGDVKFTNCIFGAGAGYNYSRPYAPTEYVGCNFEAGHKMDARATVTFENCTIDGVPLTAENLATLVTSNIANASVK